MFCKQCGAPVDDGAKFCSACGAAQDEAPAAKSGLDSFVSSAKSGLNELGDAAKSGFDTISEAVKPGLNELGDAAKSGFSALTGAVKPGMGSFFAAVISLILGVFLLCNWLTASLRAMGEHEVRGFGIFNMLECGRDLEAGGGFFAVFGLIIGCFALLAVLGSILTLVMKKDVGWKLFGAACVLVIVVFLCAFIYGLICNGCDAFEVSRAFGIRATVGASFGAWASFVIALASLIFRNKLRSI